MSRKQKAIKGIVPVNESAGMARSVLRAYRLNVEAVIKMRTVYGLVCTDDSRWILKPAPPYEHPQRLRALAEVAKHVHTESGIMLAAPVPCSSGAWMMNYAGKSWYLQKWLRGRHLNLADPHERAAAVRTIGRMHAASEKLALQYQAHLPTGSFPHRLLRKQVAVTSAWNEAAAAMPELETWRADLFTRMQNALSAAKHVAAAVAQVRVFSHRDLAPHNMLWPKALDNKNVHLIDFDRAGFDLPYLDLMQLCSHSLHFTNEPKDLFRQITNDYSQTSGVDLDDVKLVELLLFPDLFVRALLEWAKAGFGKHGRRAVLTAMAHERSRTLLCSKL